MMSLLLLALAASSASQATVFEFCPPNPNDPGKCLTGETTSTVSIHADAWVPSASQSKDWFSSPPPQSQSFGEGGGSMVWQPVAVPTQVAARVKDAWASANSKALLTGVTVSAKGDAQTVSVAGSVLGSLDAAAKYFGLTTPPGGPSSAVTTANSVAMVSATTILEFALDCAAEEPGPVAAGGLLSLNMNGCFEGTVENCFVSVQVGSAYEIVSLGPGQTVAAVPILTDLDCGITYTMTVTFHATLKAATGVVGSANPSASELCAFSGGYSANISILDE